MRHLFTLAVLLSASALLAQARLDSERGTSPKPWQLTLEQRIALRTDPELARERVRLAAQGNRHLAVNAARDTAPPVDSYTGKTHPELFLPHEVFGSLMVLAFDGPAMRSERLRRALMPEVRRVGLPEDFWERLRAASAVHLADIAAERDLGTTLGQHTGPARQRTKEVLALKQDDVCRSRADAIAAARKEFGREQFDRFLYEAIAVNQFATESELPSPRILRWIAGGCR